MLQRLGGHTRLRVHPSLRVAAFETLCAVGDTSVAFESGIIATHADGSVLATQTNPEGKRTSVLATVVADTEPRFSRNGNYTPISIDFRRPEYAGELRCAASAHSQLAGWLSMITRCMRASDCRQYDSADSESTSAATFRCREEDCHRAQPRCPSAVSLWLAQ